MWSWLKGGSITDWLMVIVTAIAALFAYLAWQATKNDSDLDKRPWVGVSLAPPDAQTVSKEHFQFVVSLAIGNYGRTPAKRAHIVAISCPLPIGQKPSFGPDCESSKVGSEWSCGGGHPGINQENVLIVPGKEISFLYIDNCLTNSGGGISQATRDGGAPATFQDFSDSNQRKIDVWMWGSVEYFDKNDTSHKTHFCGVYDQSQNSFITNRDGVGCPAEMNSSS